MARTKQTARKSSGGKAPRRQLATTSARGLRTFLTGQQRVGNVLRRSGAGGALSAAPAATSFLNHENVLGSFDFPRSPTAKEFEAHFDAATAPDQRTGLEETWLSLQFASKFDGDGIKQFDRPPLALSLVLDISGSMSWILQGDDDDESDDEDSDCPKMSKLEAAKQCVAAILEQLTPVDECSVTLFNHEVHQLSPLRCCSAAAKEAIRKSLARVTPCGGTDLTRGFVAGMRVLDDGSSAGSSEANNHSKLRRTIFLTDMESGPNDEDGVLQEARTRANDGIHTTVVGVGVDLSVGSVERLSSVPGCKYASVSNAAEFARSIGAEFCYDVMPLAFDIRVRIGGGWAFERACGFAELNSLRPGAKELAISSEFASPLNGNGEAHGGVLLLRLRRPPAEARRSSPRLAVAAEAKLELETTWRTPGGKSRTATTMVPLSPEPTTTLRKGIALVRFCDLQASFCEADEDAESLEARLHRLDACRAGRECLVSELRAVGDHTLTGANANILQTLDQIIQFEERETKGMQAEAEKRKTQKRRRSASPLASAGAHNNGNNEMPAQFLCPITKRPMTDPVSTTDGHTFERAAITRWFRGHATSPLTGLPLASKVLTPNHSLRSIIRELS